MLDRPKKNFYIRTSACLISFMTPGLMFNAVELLQSDSLPEFRAHSKLCNEHHSQPATICMYANCKYPPPQRPATLSNPPPVISDSLAVSGAPMCVQYRLLIAWVAKICQDLPLPFIHRQGANKLHIPQPHTSKLSIGYLKSERQDPNLLLYDIMQAKAKPIIFQTCTNDT